MENVNCKKLFLGALLVAFGSTQIVGTTYSQAPTHSYVPKSIPESVTIGGPVLDASHIQVQQYPSVQVLSGLSGNVGGYSAPVLNTLSTSLINPDGSVGTQVSGSVVGLAYQPVGGVQPFVDQQHIISSPQVSPLNYQLGYHTVQPVQPIIQTPVQPVQQVQPVLAVQPVQPVQQVVPVYGSQVVPNQAIGIQYQSTGVPVTGYQGTGITGSGYEGQGYQGEGVQVQPNPFNLRR